MVKIATLEEFNLAVECAEKLMDAKPGTPDGDELTKLAEMIDEYEDIYVSWGCQNNHPQHYLLAI
jgi:hypothetical protein